MSYLQALRRDSTHVASHYRLARYYLEREQSDKARVHRTEFRLLKADRGVQNQGERD